MEVGGVFVLLDEGVGEEFFGTGAGTGLLA